MFGGASNFIQSNLWAPEVPVYNGLVFSSLEPPQIISTFEPLINVDFGGLRGMLLPYLTRIVIYMVSDHRPIIGIGFFYTNRSIRFGDTNGVQLSFLINGPEGERISDISITVDDPPDRICSLEVCNHSSLGFLIADNTIPLRYRQLTVAICCLLAFIGGLSYL